MMHTRRRILIVKRGMSTFRIIDDIEMTDAPQKMNLTQNYSNTPSIWAELIINSITKSSLIKKPGI